MRVGMLLICLLPLTARAQDDLKRAEQLFEDLKYEQALKQVEKTLRSPRRGPTELVAAYRIKGLSLSALGRPVKALDAFRMLLAIDPDYQLTGVKSPKLNAPFFRAAGMTKQHGAIELIHQPPPPGKKLAGQVLTAELKTDPMKMVAKVRLRFWTEAKKPLQMSMEVKGPQVVKMRLPLDFKSDQVNYYFEAVNPHGGVLVRRGSWYQPLQLAARKVTPSPVRVEPPKPKPVVVKPPPVPLPPPAAPPPKKPEVGDWYTSWWFWTAVGVVVVGAATGTALALGGDDSNGPVDCYIDFGVR